MTAVLQIAQKEASVSQTFRLRLGPQNQAEDPLLEIHWTGAGPLGTLAVTSRTSGRLRHAQFKAEGEGMLQPLTPARHASSISTSSSVFDLRQGISRWINADRWQPGEAVFLTLEDGTQLGKVRLFTAELSPSEAKALFVRSLPSALSAEELGEDASLPVWQDFAALRSGEEARLKPLILTPLEVHLYLDERGRVVKETLDGVFSYQNHTPYRFSLAVERMDHAPPHGPTGEAKGDTM